MISCPRLLRRVAVGVNAFSAVRWAIPPARVRTERSGLGEGAHREMVRGLQRGRRGCDGQVVCRVMLSSACRARRSAGAARSKPS